MILTIELARTYRASVETQVRLPNGSAKSSEAIKEWMQRNPEWKEQLERQLDLYPPEEADAVKDEIKWTVSKT